MGELIPFPGAWHSATPPQANLFPTACFSTTCQKPMQWLLMVERPDWTEDSYGTCDNHLVYTLRSIAGDADYDESQIIRIIEA